MLWAWYPEINMHMATEYMPEEDDHGDAIDRRELISSVSGYATCLADLVNIGIFYKAYPDPHAEQGEASASTNEEAGEDLAADPSPEEAEPTSEDAGADNQDMGTPADETAAP